MDINQIVKAAYVVQAASAVALAGTALYCFKKQKEIDAITTDLDEKLARHNRAMAIARHMNLMP